MEFESLSFYNINRLIDIIFLTKKIISQNIEPKTLQNFIKSALDIEYLQTEKSAALLKPEESFKIYFSNLFWGQMLNIDLGQNEQYEKYQIKGFNKLNLKSRSDMGLVNQIHDYIESKHVIKDAPEQALTVLLEK